MIVLTNAGKAAQVIIAARKAMEVERQPIYRKAWRELIGLPDDSLARLFDAIRAVQP